MNLILASQSPYRRALLEQAGLTFQVFPPPFEEEKFRDTHQKLSPKDLCQELSLQKALSVHQIKPGNFIIGSDQLIEIDHKILGKPGGLKKAHEQLSVLSGRRHFLHTSLTLIAPNKKTFSTLRTTVVKLQSLTHEEIDAYLHVDHPFDCAGSYKMERAGLLLADSIECSDPSAIQGLSLIDLVKGFKHFGRSPFEFRKDAL